MILIDFPIMDPVRKYLIAMEWLVVFICIELGIIFLIRYNDSKKTRKNPQELSYAVLIIAYGAEWFFFIISDFYAPNTYYRTIFLNLGYLCLYLGALFFIYIMERYYIFYKKNLFTLIFLIINILFLVVFFIDMYYTQTFGIIPWPFFIVFLTTYFIKLAKKAPKRLHYAIIFLKFFIGFFLLGIGYLLTTDATTSVFGIRIRFYGDLIQVFAVFFIYVFFSSIPLLSEYDWLDKIESIYIVHTSGLPLFSKSFREGEDKIFDNIIPGALTSIQMMLNEFTQSKETSIIKKGEYQIILYPYGLIAGLIITKQDLESLRTLLKLFVKKVHSLYAEILPKWNQNLSIFKPIEGIYKNVFETA